MTTRNVNPVEKLPMNQLLWKHKDDLAGVIIRLAWRAGLKREEIHALKWEQVDYLNSTIMLSDRTIPINEDTKTSLQLWCGVLDKKGVISEYVVVSPRTKERLNPTHITNTAQRAMRKAGMQNLRLEDLRCDYIMQMRETHGDIYALRVSGMSVQTYSNLVGVSITDLADTSADDENVTQRIWELLQRNRSGVIGIALWLSQEMFLNNKEIIALTWDDFDLSRGTVRVGDQTRYILKEIITMLKTERDGRTDADDPHVILSPYTNAPMSEASFSAMLRDVLVKSGLGNVYIGEIRGNDRKSRELAQMRKFADEKGLITSRDAVRSLGIRKRVVYDRLHQLEESGELVRSGIGYVPTDRYIPPERWPDAILERVERDGYITMAITADLLHIARNQARLLLLDMVEHGRLEAVKNNRRFVKKRAE